MRARALAQRDVRRRGVFTEARGQIHWLEWSAPEDADLGDYRLAARTNPASRFTPAVMREARSRVPAAIYRQFHLNQLGAAKSSWLPPSALQECIGEPEIEDGTDVVIAVDVADQGQTAAVVWTDGRHVELWTGEGDRAVNDAGDLVRDLVERYSVLEITGDPWRARALLGPLEDAGQPCVGFPATDARLIPASDRLHHAITERSLVLPDDEQLRAASGRTVARQSRRGWRVDGPGLILALAMALDRAQSRPPPAKLLGWL
jgi:hypothetical protein